MELSEPKLVSPLLDGFIMGEAISDHHGVRCCPAIRENTDERYFVKIISIPASQVQLDALLLTGAYSDQDHALAYFKELADGVIGEKDILDRLSRVEGFVPCLGHQVQQMQDGVGYDVYLLSPYRRSLEKLMCTEPLTHLGAVNLGLDMCAALAACRRAGYLYADLKPSNIFRSDMQGFHIGDLGFISLSSLKYASLPEKYRSSYTAPEISDALSTLNDTIDIYALGLTLYQVYNNGELPFEGNAPDQVLPPPLYADYEMAEIILKACAPNPWERWQDPAQMGHALVNYMQRNCVNDTPIVPPPVVIQDEPEEIEEFLTEEENDAELAELLAMIPDEEPPAEQPEDETEEPTAADSPNEEPVVEETASEEPVETSVDTDDDFEEVQLSFMDATEEDETTPSEENTAALADTGVSDEVAQILAQADDLISHELPEPVVAPPPIDVPIPPPIVLEPETEEVSGYEASAEEDVLEIVLPENEEPSMVADEIPQPELEESTDEEETDQFTNGKRSKRIVRCCIAAAVIILLLAAAAIGGGYWYNEFYLLPIDALEIYGTENEIQVSILSAADESKLTVFCTDVYGNSRNSTVTDGRAVFTDLTPGTQYRIHVEISGLHKLTGKTTGTCTTTDVTNILNFSANRGSEDGSVVLSFSVDGPDAENWVIEYYSVLDDVPHHKEFTGHSVTITGLNVGSAYTFRLTAAEDTPLAGTLELTYTPYKIVCAQDLKVTACGGGSVTVQWTLPEDASVRNWIVRCFNDAGYDLSLTTTETTAEFTNLDHATGYTITVTAEGMPKSVSTQVTADPINITGFNAEITDPWLLNLSWDYTGTAPTDGWQLRYSVNGGEFITINCAENNALIPLSPDAAYAFEVIPVADVTFSTVPFTYGPVQTPIFEGYYVSAANMTFTMYLGSEQKNTFTPSEQASLKGAMNCTYGRSDDTIVSTFVIRSAENELISADTFSCTWAQLWRKRACTLNIPQLPTEIGEYTLDLYFNGMYVASLSFSII
jgi:serine/threonine protein kinase